MARQYGHEKVSLFGCLRLLLDQQPVSYGAFVQLVQAGFGVSQRTSKDAVGVLAAAGCVARHSNWDDARERIYTVSEAKTGLR